MPREYLFILISISFHKDFVLFYFIFSIFFLSHVFPLVSCLFLAPTRNHLAIASMSRSVVDDAVPSIFISGCYGTTQSSAVLASSVVRRKSVQIQICRAALVRRICCRFRGDVAYGLWISLVRQNVIDFLLVSQHQNEAAHRLRIQNARSTFML